MHSPSTSPTLPLLRYCFAVHFMPLYNLQAAIWNLGRKWKYFNCVQRLKAGTIGCGGTTWKKRHWLTYYHRSHVIHVQARKGRYTHDLHIIRTQQQPAIWYGLYVVHTQRICPLIRSTSCSGGRVAQIEKQGGPLGEDMARRNVGRPE